MIGINSTRTVTAPSGGQLTLLDGTTTEPHAQFVAVCSLDRGWQTRPPDAGLTGPKNVVIGPFATRQQAKAAAIKALDSEPDYIGFIVKPTHNR